MRSKSPLALMEQLVMVLVFALAAALCLQVFAFSDQTSERNETIDRAVMECQNVAETLKAAGGDMAHAQRAVEEQMGGSMSQGLLQICYDENWGVIPEGQTADCVYVLDISGIPTEVEGLQKAHIRAAAVKDISVGGSGEVLFQIMVAWQEVNGNG